MLQLHLTSSVAMLLTLKKVSTRLVRVLRIQPRAPSPLTLTSILPRRLICGSVVTQLCWTLDNIYIELLDLQPPLPRPALRLL